MQKLGGTYVFAAFGEMHPSNPAGYPAGPYNSVATVVMDGAGNYTATAKSMYNEGPAVDEFRSGTYEVNGCGVLFTATGLGTGGVGLLYTRPQRGMGSYDHTGHQCDAALCTQVTQIPRRSRMLRGFDR